MRRQPDGAKVRERREGKMVAKAGMKRWMFGLPPDPEREGARMARELIAEVKEKCGLKTSSKER
jgi:hypothetical protein